MQYRILIAAVAFVSVIVGYFMSTLAPERYEATATLFLSSATVSGEGSGDISGRVQQETSLLASRSVLAKAAEDLGAGFSQTRLSDDVTFAPDAVGGTIDVTAKAGNPAAAADIANAVVGAYQTISRANAIAQVDQAEDALSRQMEQLRAKAEDLREDAPGEGQRQQSAIVEAEILELQSRLSDMRTNAAIFGSGVSNVEQAVAPVQPSSPKPARNAALAGALGIAAATVFAYWRAGALALSKLDPSNVLSAPLLAQIPMFRRSSGGTSRNPLFDAEAAEAYQFLLSSFEYAVAHTGARSVLVTSPLEGDGKSLTSLHLARALAVQGSDVTLVDTDIRARGLTTMLKADGHKGLVDLAEGHSIDDVVRRYRISGSVYLSVIPSGESPPQPTGLLSTGRYRKALTEIISANELTIVDGGPLLTVADASAVATQVDGVLLVLRSGLDPDDLLAVQERLRLISTPLIGYVVNQVTDAGPVSHVYGRKKPSRMRRFLSTQRRVEMPSPSFSTEAGDSRGPT